LKVSEIMKRDVIAVSSGTSIREAAEIMAKHGIGSVIVLNRDGAPLGIFTERDLVKAVAKGVGLDAPIDDVMSRNLVVIQQDESAVSAAMKMIENGIRHLPVVDDKGRLVGIISIRDVLSAVAASCTFP